MDNELLLYDRINVIKDMDKKYDLEHNAYLSFSGGKDSTILHYLLDIALPNNKIPRVFINTGIEYIKIVEFVKKLAENDERFVIIAPSTKPKEVLEKYGYPFKSKQHSHNFEIYMNNRKEFNEIKKKIDNDNSLLSNYDFIHNLSRGLKTIVKYYYGIRERGRELYHSSKDMPKSLKYQFTDDFKLKLSDKCCYYMKKLPAKAYQKQSGRNIVLTGMRSEEGGMRTQLGCVITDNNGNLKKFHPLVKIDNDFEKWFIERENIDLCDLYKAPFNFKRTGCRFCPFSLDLQEQLDIASELLPVDKKVGEMFWKPIFDEYRRIDYRLKDKITIFD